MKVLKSIRITTMRDRRTNKSIKEQSNIQSINKWIKTREKHSNENVDTMRPEKFVNICKNNKPCEDQRRERKAIYTVNNNRN